MLLLACCFTGEAVLANENPPPAVTQQKTHLIQGVVKDANGALPGVVVQIKNTSIGTLTDVDGKYQLQVKAGEVLQFTFMGYHSQEVAVVNQSVLNIEMVQDTEQLGEITINAGYYSVKDKERTGSIARVTAKDIEFQPVTNPLQAIQGRMAGVSITQNSGVAGGGFDIQIRGRNSLRNATNSLIDGNQPLYIVDGVPLITEKKGTSNLSSTILPFSDISVINSMNPNDIESIEVLKDADATAIYGSKGANGVVLITTKKGTAGGTKFSVSSSTSFSKVANFAKLMNTEQFNQMRDKAFANDGITDFAEDEHDMNGNWDRNRYTDWQKELIGKTAIGKDIQLKLSGGNDNTQFSISGGHNEQTTVFSTDSNYKRNTILFSLNHRSKNDKLQVSATTNYATESNNLIENDPTSVALTLAPNSPNIYNEDGSLNWQEGTFENPLAPMNATYEYKNKSIILNSSFSYKILSSLYFKLNMGLHGNYLDENLLKPHTILDPNIGATSQRSKASKSQNNGNSYVLEPQLNWIKRTNKHTFNFLIGATIQSNNNTSISVTGSDFTSNAFLNNISAAKNKSIQSIGNSQYKYVALFSRFNYSYADKYILNLTGRRDGSSRFGDQNKFGNFGAVGGAWIFSKEDFITGTNWLSFGKLRGSYGVAGSDNIGDYQYLDTYSVSNSKYDNVVGLSPSRLHNPNFSWEKTKKLEGALELGFLNDRINTTVAWYQNRSSNQLVGIPLPGTTGFYSIQANLNATVENTGWEFTLNTINIQNRDWEWTTNFNISFPKNKLLAFPDLEGSTYANQYVVGKSTSLKKVYQYEGIDPKTGLYQFTDYNGDGKITALEDKKTVKEIGTKFHGGFQNTISYKNISLDFLLQFVKQNNYNYNRNYRMPGILVNQPIEMLDAWSENNVNANYSFYSSGEQPSISILSQLIPESDMAISDASYIRLKNISLSYLLKIPNSKLETARIYFQGQNLLTVTNYFGMDPEFSTIGWLPPLKTYAFGVQINF